MRNGRNFKTYGIWVTLVN